MGSVWNGSPRSMGDGRSMVLCWMECSAWNGWADQMGMGMVMAMRRTGCSFHNAAVLFFSLVQVPSAQLEVESRSF